MPLTLNQAIEIQRKAPESTVELDIYDFYVSKRNAMIQIWLSAIIDGESYDIPGIFVIKDVTEQYTTIIAGLEFTVTPGNYFTDAAMAPPVGASQFEVDKNGLYNALMKMYPLLAGQIT
jgi:hypothetical protein